MSLPDANLPANRLLLQYSRWTCLAWPLGIAAAGLAATFAVGWFQHPSWTKIERWGSLPFWWLASVGLTLFVALGVWAVIRQNHPLRSAQRLDERLQAKNRLETTAVYRDDASALANAQREEAAEFLRRQPAQQNLRLPMFALVLVVTALMLLHLVTLLSWSRPWLRPSMTAAKPVAAPAPPAVPRARIKWKTPQSESKAVPIEEVPLQAVAESSSGLRDLTLEITVNGQPKMSVPVPTDALEAAGSHPIQASIYLDQLEVEPFDVVSYYLRAQRIDARKLPETTSTVQFVQIKRFRDDVREMKGGEGNAAYALLTALKVAQLHLLKENFVLAHTDLGKENDDWKRENGRVGGEQAALEKKMGEAVQQFIQASIPAEIINLLTQTRPLMTEAAQKIVALENQPAIVPQGRSLALITEVEKFMVKAVARDGVVHGSKPNVEDPFRDKQQIEMKQRFKTAAGELEMLAAAQAKLAEDLAKSEAGASPAPAAGAGKPADPSEITGTPTERQTQISQRVGAVLNGKVFNPEITGHLELAHEQALGSLRHLDAGDPTAAREPAATAARELRSAAEAMDRAGEEQAKEQFADAQRELNDAAEKASGAARQNDEKTGRQSAEQAAKEAENAARKLAGEARAQQETGSGDAAKHLADLAKSIHSDDTRKALEKLRAQPRNPELARAAADRLQQLADHAAQQRQTDPLTKEEIARLADQLESARANMQRLAINEAGQRPETAGPEKANAQAPPVSDNHGPTSEKTAPPPDASGQPREGPGASSAKPGQDQPGQTPPNGQGKRGQQGRGEGQHDQRGEERGTAEKPADGQGQGQQGQRRRGQPANAPRGGQPGPQGQAATGQGKGASGQDGSGGTGQQATQNSHATSPGQAGSTGQGKGKGPKAESKGDGATPSGASDLGDTFGSQTGELQQGPIPPGPVSTQQPVYTDHAPRAAQTRDAQQVKERFARELIEEVREGTQAAATVVPGTDALTEMCAALQDIPVEMHFADRAAFFAKIDPPLLGLIHSLRVQEALTVRREHQLTEKDADLAPPAYRPAVSDYFEQLSRDYNSAPPPAEASKE